MRSWRTLLFGLAVCACACRGAAGSEVDYTQLSLEELMQLEVTTAGKKPQPVSQVPAAVYVITQDDIRRSTATSLPDLLDMVPGIHAAQITSSVSSISARGINERYSNKLLVLIDGRSVYTPLFSGVFWEVNDVMLADVERIEVIRGPGGSLWGANAVNGIINIITKRARDSQGGLIRTDIGTEGGVLSGRYGMQLSENAWIRFYGQGQERAAGYRSGGSHDDWRTGRFGTRLEWTPSPQDVLTLQGEVYDATLGRAEFIPSVVAPTYGATVINDADYSGGHALARWEHEIDEGSDLALQVYWDQARIESVVTDYDRDTVDVDFQHRFQFGDRNEVVWGAGWRGVFDTLGDAELISSQRRDRSHNLVSAFLQDEVQIVPDRLALTIGSKIEYNDYTGVEYQPTARLTWQPTERSTAWFAYTRAVRTPSRVENDFVLNAAGVPPGLLVTFTGDESIESEYLDAFELGYRAVVAERVVVDLATYYNRYDRLRTLEQVGATDFVADNRMQGEAYGVEAAVTWDVCQCWRLLGAYTFTQLDSNLDDDSADWGGSLGEENEFPRHLFYMQSTWQLRKNIELGLSVRYADNFRSEELDRYVESNAHLAWRPSEALELALNVRNLLDNHRPEHGKQNVVQDQVTEVRRSATLRATYRF